MACRILSCNSRDRSFQYGEAQRTQARHIFCISGREAFHRLGKFPRHRNETIRIRVDKLLQKFVWNRVIAKFFLLDTTHILTEYNRLLYSRFIHVVNQVIHCRWKAVRREMKEIHSKEYRWIILHKLLSPRMDMDIDSCFCSRGIQRGAQPFSMLPLSSMIKRKLGIEFFLA